MTAGRPSKYSAALAQEICGLLAEGQSLAEICRRDDMPSESMVYRWLAADLEFRERYARARESQADRYADEIIEIADDGTNDWMERRQGEETITIVDHEHIQRSKLRVDARKWLMAKMSPKKYGDRMTHAGDAENPVHYRIDAPVKETREEWLARQMGSPAGAAVGGDPGDVVH